MIDSKTLRIGSHVLYNGKRMVVCCISGAVHGADISLIEPKEIVVYKDVWACNIEPIPITAELLTGLGFEKVTLQTHPKPIIQYVDAESIKAQAEDLDVRVVPRITIQHINVRNPFWSVSAYGEDMEDNRMAVRYLHELEAFLYLTTKTELIKE